MLYLVWWAKIEKETVQEISFAPVSRGKKKEKK
jgi:hypothetical protein